MKKVLVIGGGAAGMFAAISAAEEGHEVHLFEKNEKCGKKLAKLISDDAIGTLKSTLLPLATVITPNIPEAEILADMTISNEADMLEAAKKISENVGCATLVKGGHQINDANDLLYTNGSYHWFKGKRINNSNTHGTGCTLSSAIASNLAKGYDLEASVQRAKDYISGALSAMLDLGKGSGPMDHSFALDNEFSKEKDA